jgi:hypothetical protein
MSADLTPTKIAKKSVVERMHAITQELLALSNGQDVEAHERQTIRAAAREVSAVANAIQSGRVSRS